MGIVVRDIEESLLFFKKTFGARVLKKYVFEEQNQISVDIAIGDGYIEVMAPYETGKGGTIEKYLQTHGPGLHHISLRAEDFDNDTEALKQDGVNVFGNVVMEGRKIAFTHPKTTGGFLFELLEPAK